MVSEAVFRVTHLKVKFRIVAMSQFNFTHCMNLRQVYRMNHVDNKCDNKEKKHVDFFF